MALWSKTTKTVKRFKFSSTGTGNGAVSLDHSYNVADDDNTDDDDTDDDDTDGLPGMLFRVLFCDT